MKKILSTLFTFFLVTQLSAQSLYFPPISGNNWDTISPASMGWCQQEIDTLVDYLGQINTKAFILLKDGKIVMEEYFGTFTQDSLWYWASAGKSLTGFTVGIAQQEGLLSLDDTSATYLGQGWTDSPPAKEEMITIRHQLSMTSGLDDGVPDHHCTLDTCLQYLADAGTRWAYHNAPYTLLDEVIAEATGLSLNAYINQKIKVPTGMTGLFVPQGYNNLFVSNARSMARFGLLVLNRGNWNGNQIMTDQNYFDQMVNTSQNFNLSYGYLWWLNGKPSFMVPGLQFSFPGSMNPNAPADMIAAMGKNAQFINVVPSMNLVFIRMGNAPDASEVPFLFNDSIWIHLNAAMCNVTANPKKNAQASFSFYPNPSSETLWVEGINHLEWLNILSVNGRLLQSQRGGADRIMLNTEGFSPGLYFIQKTDDAGKILDVQKLIIKRE
jgi:CubicO group peptidase (beta-lactamase class C family)